MILHLYFIRKMLWGFAATLAVFAILTLVLELIEHLRILAGKNLSFTELLSLVVLVIPKRLYEIIPLIVMISSVAVFSSMSRSSELVVTRAAGRSGFRFLSAPVAIMFGLGLLIIGVFNPFAAATGKKYDQDLSLYKGTAASSAFAAPKSGIWLRQSDGGEDLVIHARRGSLDGRTLYGPSIWGYDTNGQSTRYLRSAQATLEREEWVLKDVRIWPLPDGLLTQQPEHMDVLHLPTTLTVNQIQDSFGAPDSITFWSLPRFINDLENTGFSALRHKVWYQSQLALPLFLAALTLIGAALTIRPSRLHNNALTILGAIMIGIGFYFIRNFSTLLGDNGQISAYSAAWVPSIAAFGFALAVVLQREDG